MATAPSIKGSAFSSVIDDVRRLRDEGRLGSDELEARLEAADLALIDEKIQTALWYPIESYRRLSELLLDVEGGGDPESRAAPTPPSGCGRPACTCSSSTASSARRTRAGASGCSASATRG